MSLFKKIFSKAKPSVEVNSTLVKQLSSKLANLSGISDETVTELFEPFYHVLLKNDKQEEFLKYLNNLLGNEYFIKNNKKIATFILFCLFCAEIATKDKESELYPSVGFSKFPEITKVAIFYNMISCNTVGYEWVLSNKVIMSEAWRYLKSRTGKYKVIFEDNHDDFEVSDEELEEDFDSSDEDDIKSFFAESGIESADSAESLLDEIIDAGSEETAKQNAPVVEEENIDSNEELDDDVAVDIASLLGNNKS